MDQENIYRSIYDYDALRKELAELKKLIEQTEEQLLCAAFKVVEETYGIDLFCGATLSLTPEFEANASEFQPMIDTDDLVVEILEVCPTEDMATIRVGGLQDSIPLQMAVDMRKAYLSSFGGQQR